MADLLTLETPMPRRQGPAPQPELPLALYVHIPFCVRKCHYCDFASGPAPDAIREQYVDALVEEIHRSPWRGHPARTVFFGGGTPSELNGLQLGRIVAALRECFRFSEELDCGSRIADCGLSEPRTGSPHSTGCPNPQSAIRDPQSEWTIECNPGTVTAESLAEMRAIGFNRVSLGVQTFHEHHLRALGRIHSAPEAEVAFRTAREVGFRRVSLDLIFCLPGQTLAEWQSDLERGLALQPEHISLYNLTIEDQTEFGRRHRAGLLALPDEDLSADMYEWAIDRMSGDGFVQYEVSNFARPGEECRHNQVYWRQEPFVGLGLGAASYIDGTRWVNTRSMQRYLATAGRPEGPERALEEHLPPREACGEAIMLGLRTEAGVDLDQACTRHGLDRETTYGETVRRLREDGLLVLDGPRLKLTRRGLMLANAVCAEFL